MNLRIKPRKWLTRDRPDALVVPDAPNTTWSIEFASRTFGSWLTGPVMAASSNVLDGFDREGLGIEVDFSLLPSA